MRTLQNSHFVGEYNKKPPEGGFYDPESELTSKRKRPCLRHRRLLQRRQQRQWLHQRWRRRLRRRRQQRRDPQPVPVREREPRRRAPGRAPGPERVLRSCCRRPVRRRRRGSPRRAISSFQVPFIDRENKFPGLSERRMAAVTERKAFRPPATQQKIICRLWPLPDTGTLRYKPRVLAANEGELLSSHSFKLSRNNTRRSGSRPE